MKSAAVSELKKELSRRSFDDLVALCLRLAKFKKDNKELLTYLLLEADDENTYIERVKAEMAKQFEMVCSKNYRVMRKNVQKILRDTKRYIRYSQRKETEVELLLFFCSRLKAVVPPIDRDRTLQNIADRQIALIRKKIALLHEDLQYDFTQQLEELNNNDLGEL